MEVGKNYVFLLLEKYHVGEYIGNEGKFYKFRMKDGSIRLGNNAHDEINQLCNSNQFIEYAAENFQNRFKRNVSVWQEDYEFKVSIPRFYTEDDVSLNMIEGTMNDILEDWWSVQWRELEYNNIQCKRNEIIISFRIHDVHEVEFRYNDMEGSK